MGEVESGEAVRTASCACGALKVTVRGEPARVNICSCHACQKRSGSAFSYSGFFAEAAVVSITGESRCWRSVADSGNLQDANFCPLCGVAVFHRLQKLPGILAVSVGCFTDPDFARPPTFYWSSKRHRWLVVPEGVEMKETQ